MVFRSLGRGRSTGRGVSRLIPNTTIPGMLKLGRYAAAGIVRFGWISLGSPGESRPEIAGFSLISIGSNSQNTTPKARWVRLGSGLVAFKHRAPQCTRSCQIWKAIRIVVLVVKQGRSPIVKIYIFYDLPCSSVPYRDYDRMITKI